MTTNPKEANESYAGYTNMDGAFRLAARLEKYWHEKGYKKVRFFPVPITEVFECVGTYQLYKVCANFIGIHPCEHYR